MKNLSLQNKLLSAFLLVALLPLAILAYIDYQTTRNVLEESANQALFAVASQTAASLDNFIETTLRTTGTEAHLPAMVSYLRLSEAERAGSSAETAIDDLLNVLATKNEHISSYALLDVDGRVAYDTQSENIGKSELEESWFTFFDNERLGAQGSKSGDRTMHNIQLRNHDIFVSPVELSGITDDASIYFSSPIHDANGYYFGLLRVRFSASVLQDLLVEKNDQAGKGSFGVLFDEYNIHLGHGIEPDVNFIPIIKMQQTVVDGLIRSKRLPDLPDEQLFPMQLDHLQESLEQSGTQRFFEAEDVATGDLINQVAVANLKTMPWKVTFFQPQEIFLAPISAQTSRLISLAALITLAVTLLGLWMARRLAQPLKQLTLTAESISQGNLSARADVQTHDEIGLLASAFNAMTEMLQSHVDSLEQRVEERTHALYLTNIELQDQRDFAEQVLSSMGQGIAVVDGKSRLTYANPSFVEMSGSNEDDLFGQTPAEFFYTMQPTDIKEMQKAIQQGDSITRELAIRRPNGEVVPVLVTAAPRRRGDKVTGAIGVITDLTDIKIAERELSSARDRALESSRLKSDFLATMSHEIRTPMNGIIGMSEFLLNTPLDQEQTEFATIVQSEANSLLTIINDILDFSKVEAGKLVIDKTNFDLQLLAEQMIDLLAPKASEKQLPLQLFVDPQIPRFVHGDGGRVKQVLINLVNNAVKFTQSGKVLVQIHLKELADSGPVVMFEVIDTGSGISPEALKNLFQPFVQADGSVTRKHGGTGLGLAISKRLVELMDGHLGVETVEHKGSTFWFSLPFGSARDMDSAEIENKPALINRRALLIAESTAVVNFLPRIFRSWGMQVDIALTAAEMANQLVSTDSNPYDIVLADSAITSLNPLAIPTSLREHSPPPLMLLLADPANPVPADQARTMGYNDTLQMPIVHSTLYNHLLSHLGQDTMEIAVDVAPPIVAPEPITRNEQLTHVLVVEDYKINQKVALKQLDRLGYSADIANNGQEAIDILLKQRDLYALVLMDVQMPVKDGLTASREIRDRQDEIGAYIPIIAMTANAIKGDLEKCLAAGMNDYISKPVKTRDLGEMLTRWQNPEQALAETAPL